MFYVCLFDVKLYEDDLKKIEKCRGVSELHVKVYFSYLSIYLYLLLNCSLVHGYECCQNCLLMFKLHFPVMELQTVELVTVVQHRTSIPWHYFNSLYTPFCTTSI